MAPLLPLHTTICVPCSRVKEKCLTLAHYDQFEFEVEFTAQENARVSHLPPHCFKVKNVQVGPTNVAASPSKNHHSVPNDACTMSSPGGRAALFVLELRRNGPVVWQVAQGAILGQKMVSIV